MNLKKTRERQEIVEGLLIALKNIDNVIALIKKSKNNCRGFRRFD